MTLERHKYDVLVIGAGGAGLRAAVAFADIYVRQVASGAWTNFYFF